MKDALNNVKSRYPNAHVWSFGDSAEMADELAQLVIAGHKKASCGSLAAWQQEEEKVSPGDYHIVLDGQQKPVCVIRTTSLKLIRFDEVSAEDAAMEGEGDKSLGYWRQSHQAFFEREGTFSDDMELIFETFSLVDVSEEM
ncbi:ASCH domain-containing protein [Superficieibacter electus]|uniref:ASCH domain-containing protein n=1 Tax=Superficieibacter electus TaxID=2022662 RepID=A0A2P5GQR0_9ENTR|nr:ASCH domain-containing protein [Superficieibacter electus]POP43379.1 ASCH domain-containing protein [Superficieibacter electus]POP48895.1 ASCH domain-containing protein [Superficieibacter electus]